MEEFKGTKGIITANGLHIVCDTKMGSIGQAFLVNHAHDNRGRYIPDTEGEANAKLWAASLELLEALQNIVWQFEINIQGYESHLSYQQAKDAINKALGH